MKRMGWILLAVIFLLSGCGGRPISEYSMLRVDLSTEEALKAVLVPADGSEMIPLNGAKELYTAVKEKMVTARQVEDEGTAEGAIALYFYPEVKRDFREQYLVFTRENIVCASYSPFHNHMEFYQMPEGTYEAVHQAVFGE